MKLMTYNILFGMKGNTALRAFLSNLSIHGLRPILPFGTLPNKLRGIFVEMRSKHLDEALGLVQTENPDILCLNEVLKGLHQKALEQKLKNLGFQSIFWGISKHHSHPYDIASVLASKFPTKHIDMHIPLLAKPGGGGGHLAVFIPEKNLSVAAIHPSIWKNIRKTQLKALKKFAERELDQARRVVLMGDFNAGEKEIRETLGSLPLSGFCPEVTHPSFKFPVSLRKPQALDHILVDSSFGINYFKVISGNSDHRAVLVEVR